MRRKRLVSGARSTMVICVCVGAVGCHSVGPETDEDRLPALLDLSGRWTLEMTSLSSGGTNVDFFGPEGVRRLGPLELTLTQRRISNTTYWFCPQGFSGPVWECSPRLSPEPSLELFLADQWFEATPSSWFFEEYISAREMGGHFIWKERQGTGRICTWSGEWRAHQ